MEKDSEGAEKRTHPRITRSFIVKLRPHKNEGSQGWEVSLINNISLGGCCFYSSIPFEPGEVLDIEIQFPGLTEPIKFMGEVKRCKRNEDIKRDIYGIAIQFLKMDATKKDKFIETVTHFLKKYPQITG